MNDEALLWLQYADENRQVAVLCFESGLFNPCLQNAQQAVEKSLKALCLAIGLPLKKTHSIAELIADLRCAGSNLNFVEDDIDLLDYGLYEETSGTWWIFCPALGGSAYSGKSSDGQVVSE